MNPIHPAALRGFSDGAKAYQRGRPDYPVGLLTWLREALSHFDCRHAGPKHEVIFDRFMSISSIAALLPDEKAGVATRLRELMATHPALIGREVAEMPYVTRAFRCVRK